MSPGTYCPIDRMPCVDDLCRWNDSCLQGDGQPLLERCQECLTMIDEDGECECDDDEEGM